MTLSKGISIKNGPKGGLSAGMQLGKQPTPKPTGGVDGQDIPVGGYNPNFLAKASHPDMNYDGGLNTYSASNPA